MCLLADIWNVFKCLHTTFVRSSSTTLLPLIPVLVRRVTLICPGADSHTVVAAIEQIESKAKGIESAVLIDNGGVTAAYKAKIRSLYVNLKDKNNPDLRESIVAGDLPVARFCKMTSQEMASEERKSADSKIREENLFKTLGAEEVQAETDAFQCGRCKQVSVTFLPP